MFDFIRSLLRNLATIPALLCGLVPVFKACPPCPVCMPIYCAILSLVGLELAEYGMYLVPIMLVSMVFTLVSTFYQTQKYHKNYFIFAMTFLGCSSILTGKFVFDVMPMIYVGMATLASSVVWNRRAVRLARKSCCSHC